MIRPIVKSQGGKSSQAATINDLCGNPLPGCRFFEPFFGGGAVFFARCDPAYPARQAVLSDANPHLMNFYLCLRQDVSTLIEALQAEPFDDFTAQFYRVRDAYNARAEGWTTYGPAEPDVRAAARFLFLNRACFNGIWRVNRSGGMNVPVGKYRQIKPPDVADLKAVSEVLQASDLRCGDFGVIASAGTGDVVYCDPPFDSVNDDGFTAYAAGGFGWRDQLRLAGLLHDAAARGARVVASNADTPKIRTLYTNLGFDLREQKGRRSSGARATSRTDAAELLMTAGEVPVLAGTT